MNNELENKFPTPEGEHFGAAAPANLNGERPVAPTEGAPRVAPNPAYRPVVTPPPAPTEGAPRVVPNPAYRPVATPPPAPTEGAPRVAPSPAYRPAAASPVTPPVKGEPGNVINVTDGETRKYENNTTPVHSGDSFEKENAAPAAESVVETKIPEFNVTHTVKKPKRAWPRLIAMALTAGALFGAAFGIVNRLIPKEVIPTTKVAPTKITVEEGDTDVSGTGQVSKIAEECMPSVVAITNHSVSDVITFFGTFQRESTSSGSGIIIGQNDTELLIVTNYHVVANTKELTVVFSPVEKRLEQPGGEENVSDEDIPNATVKGYDPNKDIAVIAVRLSDIPENILSEIKVATIGDSATLKPGDQVVAIGNALGYGQSVTTGIISAVNRSITMESSDGSSVVTNNFIQTDAAINSGNSGGALLDMAGNLIGINSVKISSTGVEGMGYAIPISDVMGIIDDLMVRETRELVDEEDQGVLGITGTDVDSSDNESFGMPVGVYVSEVTEGLAAEKAGIKKGNIITKFDGYTITTIAQIQERLKYYKHGEKVSVTVMVQEGEEYVEKELEVTLSKRSENKNK